MPTRPNDPAVLNLFSRNGTALFAPSQCVASGKVQQTSYGLILLVHCRQTFRKRRSGQAFLNVNL
jgi:hypothetical protein